MADTADNVEQAPVAPEQVDAPSEQAAVAEEAAQSPEEAQPDKGEKILGKFNSVDDLAKSYQELESKFTAERQAQGATSEQVPEVGYPLPPVMANDVPFDEDTVTALETWHEQKKAQEFRRKHAQELADPILRGTVNTIIKEANDKGLYADQEEALKEAKKLIESRLQPKVQEATKGAFAEGQEVARRKELMGAVGDTSKANPKPSPDQLSSEEFARQFNLPRAN